MNIADMAVSSYTPPMLIAEGHRGSAFRQKETAALITQNRRRNQLCRKAQEILCPSAVFFFSPLWRQMFGYVSSFHSTKNRTRRISSGIFTGEVI